MEPAEILAAHTPATGALFPFAVDVVADLGQWEPKSMVIAICGEQYRINEADRDNIIGVTLQSIVTDLVGDKLTEWTPPKPARPVKKTTKPDSD